MKAKHILYTSKDFKNEEESQLADMVINGGLGICKLCGKAEIELSEDCIDLLDANEFKYIEQYENSYALAELLVERRTVEQIIELAKCEKFKNQITNTALFIVIKWCRL